MSSANGNRIPVEAGAMALSQRAGDVLVIHGLGSCLGVTAHDPQAGIGALAHIVLPKSEIDEAKARRSPYSYVDTAIPALLEALARAGANHRRLVITAAGAASRHDGKGDVFAVGKRNILALRKAVWRAGVILAAEDVGGTYARTMAFDVKTGEVKVTVREG